MLSSFNHDVFDKKANKHSIYISICLLALQKIRHSWAIQILNTDVKKIAKLKQLQSMRLTLNVSDLINNRPDKCQLVRNDVSWEN